MTTKVFVHALDKKVKVTPTGKGVVSATPTVLPKETVKEFHVWQGQDLLISELP